MTDHMLSWFLLGAKGCQAKESSDSWTLKRGRDPLESTDSGRSHGAYFPLTSSEQHYTHHLTLNWGKVAQPKLALNLMLNPFTHPPAPLILRLSFPCYSQ